MSMYNKLFGENEEATVLLGMIGVTRSFFERYRDAYLNKTGTKITVLTRLGGNNKKEYKHVYKAIRENPNFIKAYNDKFDKTYAYFEFKVPEKYKETAKKIAPKEEEPTLKEKFEKQFAEMSIAGTPAYEKANEIAEGILKAIQNGEKFIGI